MKYFTRMLRSAFWFSFNCSLGGWWFVLGVDSRRQMVAEASHWLGRIKW